MSDEVSEAVGIFIVFAPRPEASRADRTAASSAWSVNGLATISSVEPSLVADVADDIGRRKARQPAAEQDDVEPRWGESGQAFLAVASLGHLEFRRAEQ